MNIFDLLDTLYKKYGDYFWKLVINSDGSGSVESTNEDDPLFEFDELSKLQAHIEEIR